MNILIVDDSRVARNSLKKILAGLMDVQFFEADDGETAWTIIEEKKPDIVFTDWYMEKMDGLTLIRKIKQTQAAIKICMITSEANDKRQALVSSAGADCILNKPIKINELAKALERMIG